jgi:energy-coupling factor transporter ATP-binding protein EcfA2
MNLISAFEAGQKGSNRGLPMGEGLKSISSALNGIQRGRIYTIAAAPKGGKSTLVDAGFCIEPASYVLSHNAKINKSIRVITAQLETAIDTEIRSTLNLEYEKLKNQLIDFEIIYNSYEIDRVSKEFDFIAHFLNKDYGIREISLPSGKTHKSKNVVSLSSAFLKGELLYDTASPDETPEIIRVSNDLLELIKKVYRSRIIPLFGEYSTTGERLSKGLIVFLENKENPTGIRNYLLDYARENGEFIYKTSNKDGQTFSRMIGYKPNNPNKYVLIITDHLRKLIPERGFKMKETVDKFSEYSVEFRNTCNFSFVHIIHLNRGISGVDRRQYDDDRLFPQSDDIKETGNLSEDSNYILTMFNPNDDKFNLKKHFGTVIRKPDNSLIYPNMRTIHLVESRHCVCPQHFRVNMYGETKTFNPLTI